jgi:hypothetical protein
MEYAILPQSVVNSSANIKILGQDFRSAFASQRDPRNGPNLQYFLASMLLAAAASLLSNHS